MTTAEQARAELQRRREMAQVELCRRSYAEYLTYALPPGWTRTRLSDYLAEQAQEFIEDKTGNAYDILMLECPPQHGKTTSITETLPSWYMGKYPDKRVILASYNEDTAERFARRNKEKLIKHGLPLFGVTLGLSRATEFEVANHTGRLISRGVMSGITGNPANLIIIDDPIKNRQEADSETIRNRIWDEWVNSLKTRLSAGAKVIVIMTPWHEDDLSGRLIKAEKNIKLIRLPVEAEENDPLGRKLGDALCPELGKDNTWLAQYRESYINDPTGGKRAWQALFMCSPRTEDGNLVKRDWWKEYDPADITTFGSELISVDATFKGLTTSDFVAITVWGKLDGNYYKRYCLNKRMEFTETLTAIRAVKSMYPSALAVLIEDKANGSAIINVLRQEMFCIPVNPLGDKYSRASSVSPAIESGHVFLPIDGSWVEATKEQWAAFPNAPNDDIVDSDSQALAHMLFYSGILEAPPTEIEQADEEALDIFTSDDLYNVY